MENSIRKEKLKKAIIRIIKRKVSGKNIIQLEIRKAKLLSQTAKQTVMRNFIMKAELYRKKESGKVQNGLEITNFITKTGSPNTSLLIVKTGSARANKSIITKMEKFK